MKKKHKKESATDRKKRLNRHNQQVKDALRAEENADRVSILENLYWSAALGLENHLPMQFDESNRFD